MIGADASSPGERSDRRGDSGHTRTPASGERQRVDRAAQELCGGLRECRWIAQTDGGLFDSVSDDG